MNKQTRNGTKFMIKKENEIITVRQEGDGQAGRLISTNRVKETVHNNVQQSAACVVGSSEQKNALLAISVSHCAEMSKSERADVK